jgi:kinesin family protein 18/19
MQHDLFSQVMNPLVDDFLGGKSGLLVAMGPTGSGKTHTVFGTARHPGIVPLTLQKIFNTEDESDVGSQPTRYTCFGVFTTKLVQLVMYKLHILIAGLC